MRRTAQHFEYSWRASRGGRWNDLVIGGVVEAAQERYARHPLFPKVRVCNSCTFTRVHLKSRWRDDPTR